MFIFYINDLPEDIASFIFLYADDAKVFRMVEGQVEKESLQKSEGSGSAGGLGKEMAAKNQY